MKTAIYEFPPAPPSIIGTDCFQDILLAVQVSCDSRVHLECTQSSTSGDLIPSPNVLVLELRWVLTNPVNRKHAWAYLLFMISVIVPETILPHFSFAPVYSAHLFPTRVGTYRKMTRYARKY